MRATLRRGPAWTGHCLFIAVLISALVLDGAALASQEVQQGSKATQDSGMVLRQTVRRVRVDVVVTEAQGHPVTGLKASDFHVAEDGKPQSVRQFEYHNEESEKAVLPKRPPLPPHTFMNLPDAPERGPLTVVLYDLLNTAIGDQLHAHQQMTEFLKKSSGRRIALFVLGDQLRLLQGFTSNTDQLVRAVNHTGLTSRTGYDTDFSQELINRSADHQYAPITNTQAGQTTSFPPAQRELPALQRMNEKEADAMRAYARGLLDDRVNQTLDALVQIGRFLGGMPGRKNLIWYSGSFPIAVMPYSGRISNTSSRETGTMLGDSFTHSYSGKIKATTDLLNTAEVAVYPVDARGLVAMEVPFDQRSLEFATMDTLGERTGGRAFYNTNGLQEALETAAVDGSSYYSLLYAPTNTRFDGSLRHISVGLGQPRYHLAYRRSYFAKDQVAPERLGPATPEERASERAMDAASQFGAPASHEVIFAARVDTAGSPEPATAEQMAALAPYREHADGVAHRKRVSPVSPTLLQPYTIQFGMLTRQLQAPKSTDGLYHPRITVAALAFSADGETLWGTESRIAGAIEAAKMASFRSNGYQVQLPFVAPVNTSVIRLVVRDENNDRMGSMEIAIPMASNQEQTHTGESSGPSKESFPVAVP